MSDDYNYYINIRSSRFERRTTIQVLSAAITIGVFYWIYLKFFGMQKIVLMKPDDLMLIQYGNYAAAIILMGLALIVMIWQAPKLAEFSKVYLKMDKFAPFLFYTIVFILVSGYLFFSYYKITEKGILQHDLPFEKARLYQWKEIDRVEVRLVPVYTSDEDSNIIIDLMEDIKHFSHYEVNYIILMKNDKILELHKSQMYSEAIAEVDATLSAHNVEIIRDKISEYDTRSVRMPGMSGLDYSKRLILLKQLLIVEELKY